MEEDKTTLDIKVTIYLTKKFQTIFDSSIRASSFREAIELLEKAEAMMKLAEEQKENGTNI